MNNAVNFKHICVDDATPEEWELLKQFFRIRHEAYQDVWGGESFLDDGEIDTYDKQAGTIFTLALDGEKVIGGRRVIIHTPLGNQKLPLESTFKDKSFELKKLLPHLANKLDSMCYAEAGNLSIRKEYRGQGIAKTILKESYKHLERMQENDLRVDFSAFTANVKSIGIAIKAAESNGHKTMVRRDKIFKHPKVQNKTALVIQSNTPDFPFLSEAQTKARCGMNGLDYLAEEKTRQR